MITEKVRYELTWMILSCHCDRLDKTLLMYYVLVGEQRNCLEFTFDILPSGAAGGPPFLAYCSFRKDHLEGK